MGVFNKFTNYALLTVFVIFIGAAFFLGMFGGKKEPAVPTPPDMSKAVAYHIVGASENAAFNRHRLSIDITIPEYWKYTPEQLAHTAMSAAWNGYATIKNNHPDNPAKVFVAQFSPYKGRVLAKAIFAVDKKGWAGDTNLEWEVSTLSGTVPPKEYFQTEELWEELRKDYQVPDPVIKGSTITDEDALRAAISEKLNIPLDMVHLPLITMMPYEIEGSQ